MSNFNVCSSHCLSPLNHNFHVTGMPKCNQLSFYHPLCTVTSPLACSSTCLKTCLFFCITNLLINQTEQSFPTAYSPLGGKLWWEHSCAMHGRFSLFFGEHATGHPTRPAGFEGGLQKGFYSAFNCFRSVVHGWPYWSERWFLVLAEQ